MPDAFSKARHVKPIMKGVQSVTADKDRVLITKIEPHELSVSDFNECLVFYRKGLRLPLRRQQGEWAEFEVEGNPFILLGRRSTSQPDAEAISRLSLIAKDLERVTESAEAWGGSLVEGPEERETPEGPARWAIFRDPEGNELETLQPL